MHSRPLERRSKNRSRPGVVVVVEGAAGPPSGLRGLVESEPLVTLYCVRSCRLARGWLIPHATPWPGSPSSLQCRQEKTISVPPARRTTQRFRPQNSSSRRDAVVAVRVLVFSFTPQRSLPPELGLTELLFYESYDQTDVKRWGVVLPHGWSGPVLCARNLLTEHEADWKTSAPIPTATTDFPPIKHNKKEPRKTTVQSKRTLEVLPRRFIHQS